MAYNEPTTPAAYAALDDAAFEDGHATNVHVAKVIVDNSSYMLGQAAQVLALSWPRADGDVVGTTAENWDYGTHPDSYRTWVPPDFWLPISGPIPLPKPPTPANASLECRVRARVTSAHTVYLQVATRAQPFDANATRFSDNVVTLTGDGDDDIDGYTGTVRVDSGRLETMQLYARAVATTDTADANGGTWDARSDSPGDSFTYDIDRVTNTNANGWASPGWARTGASIVFRDSDGVDVARRSITNVTVGTSLHWSTPLSGHLLDVVRAGDDWQVYANPSLSLVGLTLATEAL